MTKTPTLTLLHAEPECAFSPDDLLAVVLTMAEARAQLADRLSRLLNGDMGRTLVEMAEILDAPLRDVLAAFAELSQAGAVFMLIDVAGDDKGYRLVGWV